MRELLEIRLIVEAVLRTVLELDDKDENGIVCARVFDDGCKLLVHFGVGDRRKGTLCRAKCHEGDGEKQVGQYVNRTGASM